LSNFSILLNKNMDDEQMAKQNKWAIAVKKLNET
jgi:hypothetical protein